LCLIVGFGPQPLRRKHLDKELSPDSRREK